MGIVVTEVTVVGGSQYASSMQAASTATLFLAGSLTGLSFVTVADQGEYALLTYAGVAVVMAAYAVFLLPETRGCTLEECSKRVQRTPLEVFCGAHHAGPQTKNVDEEEEMPGTPRA